MEDGKQKHKNELVLLFYLSTSSGMKLLVTAATGPEMRVLKSCIQGLRIPHLEVHFLTTGIGNYETIHTLTHHFTSLPKEKYPDFLLTIGVCGHNKEHLDVVQIARIINNATQKETIVPIPLLVAPLGTLVSSETPVYTYASDEDLFFDMEGFGVDFVAQKFQIPRILLKVPVDSIGEETKHFDYKKAIQFLETKIAYREILEKIVAFIHQTH